MIEEDLNPADLSSLMTSPEIRQQLLREFLDSQHVQELRDWQQTYVSRPFVQQTGVVLQLPPGAGKTLIAQWIILESLAFFPTKRVLFAVPLRVLAMQVKNDVERVLELFNNFIQRNGLRLPSHRGNGPPGFTVALAEGPGAVIDLNTANVVVATYEHAAGELRKDPRDIKKGDIEIHVGLVIVDEVHNIAKQDRGMVIDDIFYFTNLRNNLSSTRVTELTHPFVFGNRDSGEPQTYVMPQMIGMSGTLEDWVSKRIRDAYGGLIREILTPEQLQVAIAPVLTVRGSERAPPPPLQQVSAAKKGPSRVILDAKKFDLPATCNLALTITKGLLKRRLDFPNERPRRLVVFMSCVAEAEAAFIHVYSDHDVKKYLKELAKRKVSVVLDGQEVQTEKFTHPRIDLVNNIKELADKFGQGFGFESELQTLTRYKKTTTDFAEALEAGGVYIHHAQITAPQLPPAPGEERPITWSDIIQAQLSTDFVAVFSTSTISVGVNLASTQVGVLGPNTMWTVDQAEQMIGRVGRVNEDAENSVVAIVDSRLYHAPMSVSISVPDAWFIPRFTAAIDFSRAWALRQAGKQLEQIQARNLRYIQELAEAHTQASDSEGFTAIVQNTGKMPEIHPNDNLNVRGFFKPAGSASMHIPDRPGNGIFNLAKTWEIVSDQAEITPAAKVALEFCKQDLKSLPATRYFLNELFAYNRPTVNPESWRVFLLWAFMQVRFHPKWMQWLPVDKGPKADKAAGNKLQMDFHVTAGLPRLFPRTTDKQPFEEFREQDANARQISEVVDNIIRLFGESHVAYQGQTDLPSEANTDNVRAYADILAWALALFPDRFPTGRPTDLYNIAIDARDFLEKIIKDIGASEADEGRRMNFLTYGLRGDDIKSAIFKAVDFLDASLFPFSSIRRKDVTTLLYPNGLPLGTSSAVGYLVPATVAANNKLYSVFIEQRFTYLTTLLASQIEMAYNDAQALGLLNNELAGNSSVSVVQSQAQQVVAQQRTPRFTDTRQARQTAYEEFDPDASMVFGYSGYQEADEYGFRPTKDSKKNTKNSPESYDPDNFIL